MQLQPARGGHLLEARGESERFMGQFEGRKEPSRAMCLSHHIYIYAIYVHIYVYLHVHIHIESSWTRYKMEFGNIVTKLRRDVFFKITLFHSLQKHFIYTLGHSSQVTRTCETGAFADQCLVSERTFIRALYIHIYIYIYTHIYIYITLHYITLNSTTLQLQLQLP